MSDFNFPGVIGLSDELNKPQYPPVQPPLRPPEDPASMTPPSAPTPTELPPPVMSGAPQAKPPARPTWRDYAPPEPHGLAKFGHALASLAPRSDELFNQRPLERAERGYKAATGEYDTEFEQGLKGRAETRAEQTIPVTDSQGRTAYIPQKDYERYLATQTRQAAATEREGTKEVTQKDIAGGKEKSAEKIAGGKDKTAEDIARERAASNESIAKGRNLAQTEIARIRAAAANDPNKLTPVMKTMKQQAQATLPQISKALDETEQVAGLLGPGEGRWNEFMQGKLGVSDPKYAHYKDEISLISTAVTLAHARGRMSGELYDHFQQMFDAGKQSPENMIQALNVAQEWLSEYANMGEPGSPVGNTPAASTGGGKKIPTFGEFLKNKQQPGAKP